MDRADALLRLALVPGLGSITAAKLLSATDHPAECFDWPLHRLQAISGIGAERARRILDPNGLERVADERARCQEIGATIWTMDDPRYPKDLLRLEDPPLALWVQGEWRPTDRAAVAIVGPRRPSAYGHRQARQLAGGLARLGCCVVSGLARGIDTVAHEATVSTPEGRTVAVLGSGFDHLYPDENAGLAQSIIAGHGAVISEFPCSTRPNQGTFPRRNRIVAALSLAVVVVEATLRSGALITARLAGELGKEVLALPGPVDKAEHEGSNKLLRDGATLVRNLEDIVEEVGPLAGLAQAAGEHAFSEPTVGKALSGREKECYGLLSDEPKSIDDLVAIGGLPASAVQASLISLELKRLVKRAPGGYRKAL